MHVGVGGSTPKLDSCMSEVPEVRVAFPPDHLRLAFPTQPPPHRILLSFQSNPLTFSSQYKTCSNNIRIACYTIDHCKYNRPSCRRPCRSHRESGTRLPARTPRRRRVRGPLPTPLPGQRRRRAKNLCRRRRWNRFRLAGRRCWVSLSPPLHLARRSFRVVLKSIADRACLALLQAARWRSPNTLLSIWDTPTARLDW